MTHLFKKRWAKFIAQAAVLALVIAGAVFYIAGQKSVTIAIDGKEQVVSTRAASVQDLLTQEDITLDERDEISADPQSPLSDEQRIDISLNKSIEVVLDGEERVVHTTGMTVADVINELDVDQDAKLSQAEDLAISALSGGLEIITPKEVTLKQGKDSKKLSTTAETIADLFKEEDVKLDKDDEIQVRIDDETEKDVDAKTAIVEGSEIRAIKVEIKTWDETRDIDFKTTKVKDKDLDKGKTKVKTEGEKGERKLTLRQEIRDGKKGEEEVLKSKVSKEPVTEVVRVGTKKPESSSSSDSSGSSKTKAPTGSISSTWAALAKCESGGNWSINTGNGYYGGLQFSASSWRAVGGTKYAPLPHQATAQEQIAAAERLRASGGWGHWPACARKLGLI
ncbi:transglycosylase family protein [Glutamicibacter endophyticus]|uniref:transglycosylase family protein n=1 Tax=Glutamicibacter endophyticus TaxID=1522174 RepID=UPI003AF1CED1